MTPRALVVDVYRTLLEVGPPPADAGIRWIELARATLGRTDPPALDALAASCDALVRSVHDQCRAQGIAHPEVDWCRVMGEALPGLGSLSPGEREVFLVEHARLCRTIRLAPHAGQVLASARARGLRLGIASNAQAYTLTELRDALAIEHLDPGILFQDPELRYWSFEHGFSKPDPHVFRLLTIRLGRYGIAPEEILMVGDRLDNDVAPALNAGWRAWHLDTSPASGRDWKSLATHLQLSAD